MEPPRVSSRGKQKNGQVRIFPTLQKSSYLRAVRRITKYPFPLPRVQKPRASVDIASEWARVEIKAKFSM